MKRHRSEDPDTFRVRDRGRHEAVDQRMNLPSERRALRLKERGHEEWMFLKFDDPRLARFVVPDDA